MLMRIVSPYFTAGAVFRLNIDTNGARWVCTRAAPIVKWAVSKTLDQVIKHVDQKKWHYKIL
jgi:hypothetical protein